MLYSNFVSTVIHPRLTRLVSTRQFCIVRSCNRPICYFIQALSGSRSSGQLVRYFYRVVIHPVSSAPVTSSSSSSSFARRRLDWIDYWIDLYADLIYWICRRIFIDNKFCVFEPYSKIYSDSDCGLNSNYLLDKIRIDCRIELLLNLIGLPETIRNRQLTATKLFCLFASNFVFISADLFVHWQSCRQAPVRAVQADQGSRLCLFLFLDLPFSVFI